MYIFQKMRETKKKKKKKEVEEEEKKKKGTERQTKKTEIKQGKWTG